MKYGLVYWKKTNNIGDDIQAYAASRFLPHIDYYIDREFVHAFQSVQKEKVAVIMNAWWLYNTFNWPPSNDIIPLLVSMHFSDHNDADYLNGLGGKYLKDCGPVGCRDYHTAELLKKKNIECFFSGCLTLTLPKQPIKKGDTPYICVCDLPTKVEKHVQSIAQKHGIRVIRTNHYLPPEKISDDWEKRRDEVEKLLGLYQNAKCVVTSRLHCALPCLAMEVPVLLVHNGDPGARFGPFLPLLWTEDEKVFCEGKGQYDPVAPPENKPDYQKLREELIQRVRSFVDQVERDPEAFPSVNYSWEERTEWQTNLIQGRLNELQTKSKAELKKFVASRGVKQTLFLLAESAKQLPRAIIKSLQYRL